MYNIVVWYDCLHIQRWYACLNCRTDSNIHTKTYVRPSTSNMAVWFFSKTDYIQNSIRYWNICWSFFFASVNWSTSRKPSNMKILNPGWSWFATVPFSYYLWSFSRYSFLILHYHAGTVSFRGWLSLVLWPTHVN